MLPEYEHREVKKEIKAIKSQIESLEFFLNATQINPKELFTQLRALQGKVNKSIDTIFDDLLRKYLAEYLVKSIEECPGECEHCNNLQEKKERFPHLKINEVANILVELKKNEKNT